MVGNPRIYTHKTHTLLQLCEFIDDALRCSEQHGCRKEICMRATSTNMEKRERETKLGQSGNEQNEPSQNGQLATSDTWTWFGYKKVWDTNRKKKRKKKRRKMKSEFPFCGVDILNCHNKLSFPCSHFYRLLILFWENVIIIVWIWKILVVSYGPTPSWSILLFCIHLYSSLY